MAKQILLIGNDPCDALLDSVLTEELVAEGRFVLIDAVGAVGSLGRSV